MSCPERFWYTLTPESALLIRVYAMHCHDNAADKVNDLPVSSDIAFHLQEACNALFDVIEDLEDSEEGIEGGPKTDAGKGQESVVAELTKLLTSCDFSDEIGRRAVLGVIREYFAEFRLLLFILAHV